MAALRKQADLSLAEVAAVAHVARGYIHHIEHGRRWPTQGVVKALDNALNAGGAVLAATRRLEDQVGSAAVLPGVRNNHVLACGLLADARGLVRDRVGILAGELHQYLGWLLIQTGHPKRAQRELNAALALGVEFGDPDLTSLALSLKGNLAWLADDPHGVIALARAASRDERVFVAQHAYNAYQEARGWAMADEPAEVHRAL